MSTNHAQSDPLHGWLAAAIPVGATRFRVMDPGLAETLAHAGAVLVHDRPDVEIAATGAVEGDAPWVVVVVDAAQPEGGSLPVRAGRRVVGSGRARLAGALAARHLRERGYEDVVRVPWDIEQVIRIPDADGRRRGLRVAELVPQRALVLGQRGPAAATCLEAARDDAADAIGTPLRHGWPLARAQTLVVVADAGVLRVAIGPGARGMQLQRASLEQLRECAPSRVVADRVPWTLARGTAGLAEWSLEQRLQGSTAPPRLSDSVLADCVDFLVALHFAGHADARPPAPVEDAAVVAAVLDDERGGAVRALGQRLLRELDGVPRGFGHGDFWSGNLLVRDGSMAGVVDWDVGAPDRLPFLDLLQLRLSEHRAQTRQYVGDAVVDYLLPWARAGGDDVAGAYARRLGIEVGPERLEALVYAFWLDYVAHELRKYGDRTARPLWMRANIEVVADALNG